MIIVNMNNKKESFTMQLENFINISEIKKSRSTPWRFTGNTEISSSENFKMKNGSMAYE
jgi:hypothetical protein